MFRKTTALFAACLLSLSLIAKVQDKPLQQPSPEKPAAQETTPSQVAQQIKVLEGYKSYVGSLAFSPNGKFLATASNDRIKVWYTPTWQGSQSFVSNTGPFNAVAFAPNGGAMAAATMGRVIIWKTVNWQPARSLEWAVDTVPPGDKTKEAKQPNPVPKKMDKKPPAANPAVTEEKEPVDVTCLAYSPDSALIAAGSSHTGDVKIWDTGTGKELRTLKKHAFGVTAIAFSPDGKLLVTSDSGGSIVLWETQKWTSQRMYTHDGGVTSIAVSPNGKQIASGGRTGTGKLWSATMNSSLTLARHAEPIRSVAYSPDGKALVFASEDGTVSLWNPAAHQSLGKLTGLDSVFSVGFSPKDETMATGAWDLTVRVWKLAALESKPESGPGSKVGAKPDVNKSDAAGVKPADKGATTEKRP